MNHYKIRKNLLQLPAILIMIRLFCRFSVLAGVLPGTVINGPGGSGVTMRGFWSVMENQAGAAGYASLAIGVSMQRTFMLKETGSGTIAVLLPLARNTFCLSYQQFGFSDFSQQKTGFGLARSFGERFSVGVQLDYLSTHISEGYGRGGGVTFELGIQVDLSDDLVLAAHVFNPLGQKILKSEGENPEGVYRAGLQYRPGRDVFIFLETGKEIRYKPVIKAGLEYQISTLATVRFGFSSLPAPVHDDNFSQAAVFSFGYGLEFNTIRIDLSARLHNMAGWSPAVSVRYDIREIDR